MERHHPKKSGLFFSILAILVGTLVVVLTASAFGYSKNPEYKSPVQVIVSEIPKIIVKEADPIKMIFVGDMMFDRGVESSVNNNFDGDFNGLFEHIDFTEADIVFGNLEGPVSDKGRNVGSKWSFRMDPATLPAMTKAGFNIVSFANNHVGDWTQAAFEDTLVRLDENNILYTGAGDNYEDAKQPVIMTVDDVSIGFLGFTDVGPNWMEAKDATAGILIASDPNFEEIIQTANEQVDFLITSFHWGEEYIPHNSRQTELAHTAIDSGSDLVVGHHPHVIQGTEWYKEKLIAYSLGNFVFDQYFSNETMQGMVLELELEDGEITKNKKSIVELDRRYQPQELRDFEITDVVTSRISTQSLCPKISTWHENKSLFDVNRENSLGNYEPQQITHMNNRIDARGTMTCLTPETANALESMVNDSRAEGLKFVMTSGYRPYATQKILYEKNQADNPNAAYPSVAEHGHSEHQLGTTVDLKSLNTEELSYAQFEGSDEYTWLLENAHTYGFVQSYEEGKEEITGYIPEPWHWRYVGKEIAKEVKEKGLALTEFLDDYAL